MERSRRNILGERRRNHEASGKHTTAAIPVVGGAGSAVKRHWRISLRLGNDVKGPKDVNRRVWSGEGPMEQEREEPQG